MDTLSRGSYDFPSLSLKDLLQARDLFHYHLMNKKNVVATAVGLYRIRHDDPWPSEEEPHGDTEPEAEAPEDALQLGGAAILMALHIRFCVELGG